MTKSVMVSHNLLKCSESLKAMSLPTASTSCSPADTFPRKRLSYMFIFKGKLSCMPLSSGGSWAAEPKAIPSGFLHHSLLTSWTCWVQSS